MEPQSQEAEAKPAANDLYILPGAPVGVRPRRKRKARNSKSGVEVTGAGSQCVNGWYRRRDVWDGPPEGWPCSITYEGQWSRCHWYEKDDGSCYIYQYNRSENWWLLNKSSVDSRCVSNYYWIGSTPTGLPDRFAESGSRGEKPSPTLRVVS